MSTRDESLADRLKQEWVNDLFGGHGADSEDMIEDIIEDNAEFLDVDAGVGDMAADMDDTYA